MSGSHPNIMELEAAIYGRRSVRHYQERAVESALIDQLLRAAVWAPSALNQQPWAFGVFMGKDRLRQFSDRAKAHLLVTLSPAFDVNPRSQLYADPDYNIFHDAGALIVVYASRGRLHPEEDCCLAAENLMLAACGLGLGTCPIGFARSWLNLPEIKREFDIPSDYTAVFPIVLGYPAENPAPPSRRDPIILKWLESPDNGGPTLRRE